ncbi:MAG: potassium channel family protein [Lachnospiraceae bacterium]
MENILIIGMGRFGKKLALDLVARGNDIMVVDINEDKLEDVLPYVSNVKIGDCTNPDVLRSLGVRNFDAVVVCIGTNFQSSLEVTCLAKELGAKYVISKATRDIHAKFLARNGADEIVYPDRDVAERLAVRISAANIFDYIELNEDYSIYEISAYTPWIGKSIRQLNIQAVYNINVLATKVGDEVRPMPSADHILTQEEHLMVLGKNTDVEKLLKRM